MNLQFIAEYLHRDAEKLRMMDKILARDMHKLADHILTDFYLCEECGGIMEFYQNVCPGSQDHEMGFRQIRRCVDCGEMEVK